MGDINQLTYLTTYLPKINGPVIEIGSKDYGSTQNFRVLYPGEYLAIDMEAGRNVDFVIDLSLGVGPLKRRHYALAICCSVLEHVSKPWVFAEHLTTLIRPGGTLYISVPWVWRYHPYPDDYWRFSWKGIQELFPAFKWRDIIYSTNVPGELFLAMKGADDAMASFVGKRKHLPYLCVNMLGTKL